MRIIGAALLVVLVVSTGGPRARADRPPSATPAIVLALAAVLSPATLPWYLSWGFCLLAMTAWSAAVAAVDGVGSVWLMVAYYPTGEDALYNWGFLAVGGARRAGRRVAAAAGPVAAGRGARRPAAPEAVVTELPTAPADDPEVTPAAAVEASGTTAPAGAQQHAG